MKTLIKSLAAAGAVAIASTGAWAAGEEAATEGEHKFELAAGYYGDCNGVEEADFEQIQEDVRAFTDMVVMAETLNDPEKLFKLMDVVNHPHTVHVMTKCALEPVMWDTWMAGMFNPEKWIDATIAVMNPEGMVKWALSPLNGEIYKSAFNHLNPEKYYDWGVALVNPTFYEPVTDMLDLDWYEPRLAWFIEPDSYAPMLQVFDLEKYNLD